MCNYMNCYLIRYEDEQLAIKFNIPPIEVIQMKAEVYTISPGTPIGYIETWIEQGYPNTEYIRRIQNI
jgi:hypothetical protein